MAKKTKRAKLPAQIGRGPRGRTGRTGAAGATGPAGPAGRDHTSEIAALTTQVAELVVGLESNVRQTGALATQVAELVKHLEIQLTRMAQIQAQLDRIVGTDRSSRRVTDTVTN